MRVAGDDEVANRVAALTATASKLAGDAAVTGWTTLERVLGANGPTIVRHIREWLGCATPAFIPTARTANTARYIPLPAWRPFPTHCLPEPWATFVREGATALGCDETYLALPALSVIAGAIGNTRRIYLGREWYEPAVVWSAIVGDSGTLKSPALNLVTEPLRARQQRLIKEHEQEQQAYQQQMREYRAACKAGDGEGTEPPEPPALARLFCSDVTIERLAGLLKENPRGLLVVRDELAEWLGSFTRYKGSAGGTDLPNWLEMHRAGFVQVDRKTGDERYVHVPHAAVSVCSGIQPAVLARAMTPEFLSSGLVVRLLFAMPPRRPKVWTEAEVSGPIKAAVERGLGALLNLKPAENAEGDEVPVVIKLGEEAKVEWVRFYGKWAQLQQDSEGDLAAAYAKLEGYAARFALVHHVATYATSRFGDDCPVAAKSVRAGVELARWFAYEAARVYRALCEGPTGRETRKLVEAVEKLAASRPEGVTAREVSRSSPTRFPDAGDPGWCPTTAFYHGWGGDNSFKRKLAWLVGWDRGVRYPNPTPDELLLRRPAAYDVVYRRVYRALHARRAAKRPR